MKLSLNVNGDPLEIEAEVNARLLDVLHRAD